MTLIITELGPVNVPSSSMMVVEHSSKEKCEEAASRWFAQLPTPRDGKQLIVKSAICTEK